MPRAKKVKTAEDYCVKCPLYPDKEKYFVGSVKGCTKSNLIIIDQCESLESNDTLLDLVTIAGGDVNIEQIDAVKCWRGKWPDNPPAKAITCCRDAYLANEIKQSKAKRVITLGRTAAHAIFRRVLRIEKLLGHPELLYDRWILATWHPSQYVRTGQRQILIDILRCLKWGLQG